MDAFEKLYSTSPLKNIAQGTILYTQAETISFGYAVKSGIVRSYIITSSGEERSISLTVKGELLPLSWMFDKSDQALFYYVAHTDCVLYRINKKDITSNLKKFPELSYDVLRHSANDHVLKALQISALEQVTARAKLLHILHYFVVGYGHALLKDTVRISIQLTQKDIASFAGLTRETVAVELAKLRREHVIAITKKYYTVNRSLLNILIDEQHRAITLER